MNDLRQAAEMALDALENVPIEYDFHGKPMDAEFGEQLETTLQALRQALAQPEQEPVAWQNKELPMEFYEYEHLDPMWHHHYRPLYTAPPSKPWVGLENIDFQYQPPAEVITMKYAEAILKEKNK